MPYPLGFLFTSSFPQFGLVHSLAIAAGYQWREVTSSICVRNGQHVIPVNIVPSISATIGDYAICRQVWGYWIGLYIGFRLPAVIAFYVSYHPMLMGKETTLNIKVTLHIVEQLCLLGLTVVTSKENLLFHQIYFALFWAASVLSLIVTTWINQQVVATNRVPTAGIGLQRLRAALFMRRWLLFVHLASSVSAFYWYFAHETYCQDYQYTYFAISEWALVFSNVYFHMCEVFETYDLTITLQRQPYLASGAVVPLAEEKKT